MARGDLLRLAPAVHFKEDGIHITRHKTANKTGKSTIYEWNDDLHDAIARALSVRSATQSSLLFCTRDGSGYIDEVKETASGWDSMWQRFMVRIMAETKLAERFTEHDLRAKCASDAESLEHARALLSHVDSRVTDRIYRRKPERVKPGKLGFE
jgi:integrase